MADRIDELRALSLEGVSQNFDGFVALNSVTLMFEPRVTTAVIGPNGSGKTTLVDCISRTVPITSGTVTWGARRIDGLRPDAVARAGIARTFQNVEPFRALTPLQFALFGRHSYFRSGRLSTALSMPWAAREEKGHRDLVRSLLADFDMEQWQDRPLGTLPYAIRKMADLLRALAMEPELILLDEPSAGMSGLQRDWMAEKLSFISRERVRTVVIIDHAMNFIRDTCSQAMVLNAGSLIASGPIAEVMGDRAVQSVYLGSTETQER